MRSRTLACVTLVIAAVVAAYGQVRPQSASSSGYLVPPKVIVDILDAPPTPAVAVAPGGRTIALQTRRGMPTIAELAQPIHRIAGARISPRTNGRQQRGGNITAITLKSVADGTERKVTLPPDPNVGHVSFSPDGKQLALTNTKENAIELWVADVATGQAKLLSGTDRLNGTSGDPCHWLHDSATLLCQLVPSGRGPAPVEDAVPSGPNIQETSGKAAPAPTYQDLIKTNHDEALFEYYFTSQLATIESATGRKTPIGKPGIFETASAAPNDQYILVSRLKRSFSRLLPMSGFPEDVEIWNRRGELARKIADVPSNEGVPINGVITGPRGYHWRPDQPATIVWTEALDEGNLRNKVPFRDKVVSLSAPFTGNPTEMAKTEFRFSGLSFTEKGIGLLSEADRATRTTRTWLLESGAAPRKLWERRQENRYGDPGSPLARRDGDGRGGGRAGGPTGAILQAGDSIYLRGEGASPEGDRPFLDRLNLKTLQTERLFRAEAKTLEEVIAPLSDDAKTLLTRYETPTDPPNYLVRDLSTGTKRTLTDFKDGQPHLRGIERQFVTYTRKDGVKLSATLYLPPGYQQGQRLPVVMWAYPREFTDADAAGQISGSLSRFLSVSGPSHLLLLTQGYAVFDNPTMPIIGRGEAANDTYVDHLVASAEAAVNKVVELGVGDRDRIGVGGHSYGAFMAANLLAHSDIFRAGIARSGAYNRTLTPFGFQSERRTFWEVPQIYGQMSPFFNANKINEPILLTHGEADDNSGTFPIQSERLYMALKGHGATVRYVTLPYEAHGYAGRESVLHTVAEMLNWMDKYVKNPSPRRTTTSAER